MTPSRSTALLLTLLLAACTTLPRRGQVSMRDVAFPLKDRTLPSGLRVVVEEDHTEPLVAVVTLIGAGGANDPRGKEGLAHFVEHLTFRSKPDAKGPNVWNQLEQAGVGSINAFTSLDYTLYYAVGPKEILPELLRLHGLLVTTPVLGVTPQVFDVEREVVRSELRQRNETGVLSQAFNWTQEAVFPEDHPYHRPLAGTHESLSAIDAGDVSSFARKYYRPENATMVIIGDVDLKAIDPVLEASFHSVLFRGPGIVPSRLRAEGQKPPLREPLPWEVHHGSVLTPELYLGWSLPRSFDADSHLMRYAVNSASEVLPRAGWVDSDILGAHMILIPGKEASFVLCRVVLARGSHPQRSAEVVLDQLYKAWGSSSDGNPTLDAQTEQVEQAHKRLQSVVGMLTEGQDLTSRAIFRAETTHFFKDPVAYSRALGTIARVESSRVQEFSFKYLNRERARVVYVEPHPPGTAPAVTATGLGTDAADMVEVTAATAPTALKDRDPPRRFSKATTTQLQNGLELVVLPRPGLPLVTVSVLLRGGKAVASPAGVADVAGWIGFPGSRLNGSPSEVGANARSWFDEDALRYEYSGAAGNLPNLLAMAAERIPSMKINEWVLREVKKEYFPNFKVVEARPELAASRAFQKALFGDHPYGQVATVDDYEQVAFQDVLGWFGRTHVPANAVVVIAGDVQPEEAVKQATHWLGQWSGSGAARPTPAPPDFSQRAPAPIITHKPGATQTVLRMGCLLEAPDAAARARHRLLAEVLGNELNTTVRERMAASYGIGADVRLYPGGVTRLELGGAINRERFPQALEVIQTAVQGHAASGFEDTAVARARWRLIRAHEVAFRSNADAAAAVLRAKKVGAALEELDALPTTLQSIGAPALQRELKACLDHGLVLSALGDEPSIQKALSTAKQPPAK